MLIDGVQAATMWLMPHNQNDNEQARGHRMRALDIKTVWENTLPSSPGAKLHLPEESVESVSTGGILHKGVHLNVRSGLNRVLDA